MPKGIEKDALGNAGTSFGNAQNLYGSLAPELMSQAAAPPGYTSAQKAAMNTAGQQSAGGTQAAAVGQGALLASRTKNAGTADAAIAQGARTGGALANNAALSTETKNADLQQRQREQALQEEGGLYGTSLGASNQALGIADQAAENNPWMKLLLQGMASGGQVGAAALKGPAAAAGG